MPKLGEWGGEVIWAMPERKHFFFRRASLMCVCVQIQKYSCCLCALLAGFKSEFGLVRIAEIPVFFLHTKISLFGPYCAISETLQNFNIFLELFHFGTAELICQNKVLGVVGGVLGWNTLLIFQSLF